eukprot:2153481-Pyramimonas_sp.AAC.1
MAITEERRAVKEARKVAAAKVAPGVPDVKALRAHMDGFKTLLVGLQHADARAGLETKYSEFVKAFGSSFAAPIDVDEVSWLGLDEVDVNAAMGVEGVSEAAKRQIIDSLKAASKKPRFRAPGRGGNPTAGAHSAMADYSHPNA